MIVILAFMFTACNMIRTKILQTSRNMIYGLQKIPCINKQMTDKKVKMQSERMKILKYRPNFHFCRDTLRCYLLCQCHPVYNNCTCRDMMLDLVSSDTL